MRADDLVLVQGARRTRRVLEAWRAAPLPVLGAWLLLSASISAALLLAVAAIGLASEPDSTWIVQPGLGTAQDADAVLHVLHRNGLVLALHAMACVAGFIAGSSLPLEAERYGGLWRKVHDHAGPLAILFVSAATLFSLGTQAYVLGTNASTLAAQLGTSVPLLLCALCLHAVPELVALFLPLAAWLVASRRDAWDELLAATLVTVAIAVPVLVGASLLEVHVTPELLLRLRS